MLGRTDHGYVDEGSRKLVRQVGQISECGGVECEDVFWVTSSGGQHRREWSGRSSNADMVWIGVDQTRIFSNGWLLGEARRHFDGRHFLATGHELALWCSPLAASRCDDESKAAVNDTGGLSAGEWKGSWLVCFLMEGRCETPRPQETSISRTWWIADAVVES